MLRKKKIVTYRFGEIIFSDHPPEYSKDEFLDTLSHELPLPYEKMVFESENDFLIATQNLLEIHVKNIKASERNLTNWLIPDKIRNNLNQDLMSAIPNLEKSDIKTEFRFGKSSRIELFEFNKKTHVILHIGIEARGKVSTQIGELINDVAKVTTQEYTTRWVDSGYPIKIDVCYEESYQSVYGFGE